MGDQSLLADRFEAQRPQLRAVAYQMLGSLPEAEDAVQEAWFKLSRTDVSEVRELGAWLTTVVRRVCLDMLRSRSSRREDPLPEQEECPLQGPAISESVNPEQEILVADSVGVALMVVLETLSPPERLALILHDMFDVPFEEISPILGRTSASTRQLASRARRRVQGAPPAADTDASRRRQAVDAFLSACRGGDFQALLAVLDPEAVAAPAPTRPRPLLNHASHRQRPKWDPRRSYPGYQADRRPVQLRNSSSRTESSRAPIVSRVTTWPS